MANHILIKPRHRQILERLLRKHLPGVEVWAYGSRVNGRGHDGSDLDLVLRAPDLKAIPDCQLSDFEDSIRESTIPFLVEARDWARLPERFHLEINRDHEVLIPSKSEMTRGWLFHPWFPSHWKSSSLYSMATWVNGIAFRNIQFSDSGWPVIKIAEIKSGISGQTKFTHQVFDESVLVQSGDLLFSWSGQPETSINAFWWRGRDGWLNQHVFKVNPIKDLDPNFFYYLLRYLKPNFVAIARNKQTTGLGHVTKRDLENMEVAYPVLAEQRAIARILGTLDDKIELNRRMKQTLESIAWAIFKDWFVDFGPVRAKMDGRDTGLPKEIADLFPDRLVDSDLGKIPESWGVSQLGEMIDLSYGKALKSASRNAAGKVPVFGSKGRIGWHNEALVEKPGIVVGRKGHPGTVTLSPSEFFPIDTTFYVVPKYGECLYFLFFALQEQDLPSLAADSAVPGLNRNLAYMNKQLKPPASLLRCFDGLGSNLYARLGQAAAEINSLGSVRDTLLPKLVSGEIRIPDAENLVGELA